MKIIQNIWLALTSENALLTTLITAPILFVEMTLSMLLFTTILNIKAKKSQKIKYVISISIFAIISKFLIPQPYNTFINMIALPIFIVKFLKASIFQSIFSEILMFITTAILESFIVGICYNIFSISATTIAVVPLYRLLLSLTVYFFIFCMYIILKHLKFNINMLYNVNSKTKILFFINVGIATIIIGIQFYLLYFYSTLLPAIILVFSILMLLSYLCISLYSLVETSKHQSTKKDLQQAILYNRTLTILHDNIRAFKHDFNNIVQSLGGYISTNDVDGLKKFYSNLIGDCKSSNNLAALSPNVINDPAIYNLITSKYHKALDLGITINLEVFLDLKTLNIKIYEFTRILGILLDNAIEATSECKNKKIDILIQKDSSCNRQVTIVKNTYKDKQIDTEKIYEKGFSTKPNNTGLGLWKVREILKCNDNLNLHTSKDDTYFSQQLEIY